jgi:hypothetical protein
VSGYVSTDACDINLQPYFSTSFSKTLNIQSNAIIILLGSGSITGHTVKVYQQ